MDRESREINTPGGKKVVVKAWLTAREAMGVFGKQDQSDADKANALALAAIISIDGSAENIGDRLLDLPLPDYVAVLNELKTIAEGFPSVK